MTLPPSSQVSPRVRSRLVTHSLHPKRRSFSSTHKRQRAEPRIPPLLQLMVLSARTANALEDATRDLAQCLRQHLDADLADVASSTNLACKPLAYVRRMALCSNLADATQVFGGADAQRMSTRSCDRKQRSLVFVFPGESAPAIDMGRELYEQEPVFRSCVDECLDAVETACTDRSATCAVSLQRQHRSRGTTRRTTTDCSAAVVHRAMGDGPPADVAWHPAGALMGLGAGEYTAACLAGVISVDDALALTAHLSTVETNPDGFQQLLENVTLKQPNIAYVSNLSGTWITPDEATDPQYWLKLASQSAHSTDGVRRLVQNSGDVLLEDCPGPDRGAVPATMGLCCVPPSIGARLENQFPAQHRRTTVVGRRRHRLVGVSSHAASTAARRSAASPCTRRRQP